MLGNWRTMVGDWRARSREWLRRRFSRTPEENLGRRGEKAAARFLRSLGHIIVARGRRSGWGELDLVTVETTPAGRAVVFVEVKTRASHDAGHPAEAVTPEKQRRLTREALGFLKRHGLMEHRSRFDVVAVTWPPEEKRPTIEHYQNAFEAVGRGQMYS